MATANPAMNPAVYERAGLDIMKFHAESFNKAAK